MKKRLSVKKMVAWALTAAMLFTESGVVSAAENACAEENYALQAEWVSASGEEAFPESEAASEVEEVPESEETSEETSQSEESAGESEETEASEESSAGSGESSGEEASAEREDPAESEELPAESEAPSEESSAESEAPSEEEPSEGEASSENGETSGEIGAVPGEPTAEISETEEAALAKPAATGDQILKACGSDGILYSGVSYLSAATVLGFDADTREAYLELCDEIARWKQNGDAVSDIVLFTDRNGDLGFSYFITNEYFSVEGVYEEQDAVGDENSNGTGVTILRGTDARDVLEQAADEAGLTVAAGENLSLADSLAVAEETFETEDLEQESFYTYYSNENYFRNQLTSVEKSIYDAAKAKMVRGSSNSFSFKTTTKPTSANICNALSAIQDAYPSSFEWVERGAGGASTSGYLRGGTWELTTTIKKSKHYSSGLISSAKKKVKTLMEEAYAYAEKSYPNAPAYGIIKYFDAWICANNYYNNVGLGSTAQDLASKEFYYCHSSVGILLKGYGVCESYALAMNRLLDEAGIPSMVVYGTGNGGGHAWNYVQMPNGSWYMLDSTWNDAGASSNGGYLLTAADTSHVATGARYTSGSNFTYPTLAASKYASANETISLSDSQLVLSKSVKQQLTMASYYSRFQYTWESSDPKVAKVDAKGKVTAVAPGKATITLKIAGKKTTCTVYVYQWDGLQFQTNQKATLTSAFGNANTTFDSADLQTYSINVNQKNATLTASQILSNATGVAAPKVTTNNEKVAKVSSCTLSGNVITLKVQPLKTGTAKINVSFGGKKATLTLKVTQNLQSSWFNALPVTSTAYTGKAVKPKVTASATMPKGVKYKVSYKNNINAGTATVVITGTGSYSGTIEKTFQITARDFTKAEFVSCTASKTYTGKANPAATVVKWGGKKLKAGADYVVYYNNSATVPVNAGTYTVKVVGTGNYSGTLTKTFTYTINKAPVTGLKVTCPSSVKYNNGAAVTPTVTIKIGSTVISSSNYTLQWKNASGAVVTSLTEKGKYTLTVTPKGNVEATARKQVITKTVTVK